MCTGSLIKRLFEQRGIGYRWIRAPDAVSLREDWLERTVPLESVARIRLLGDEEGLILAVLPRSHELDVNKLRHILRRPVDFYNADEPLERLSRVLATHTFPITRANGFQFIVDEALSNQDAVHFVADKACSLLRISGSDLQSFSDDVLIGSVFSNPPPATADAEGAAAPKRDLQARLARMDRLPAMPDMPARILALRNNPQSTVDDLVALVEQDLSLCALIIRYANSAIFQHPAPVVSIKDAIFRVLGYESVLNLSLGYALGRVFKLPQDGPLGHTQFWQHATYTAALTHRLCTLMPKAERPNPGGAYLAGLLHDIGFLVLFLFFRNEYTWLNKMLQAKDDTPVVDIERRLLGLTHMELGGWLTQAWNLPGELVVTASHHHHLDYQGEHAAYVRLINLSERLLKMHNLSDASSDEIPARLLTELGLDEESVLLAMDEVLAGGETFRDMAMAVSA